MRIAIVTFHSSQNYGAVLQCYALQTVLIEMGHDIEIIDRLFDKFNIPSYRFKRVKKVIFPNYFERFREKFLKLSEHINSQQDLYDIQNRYDVIKQAVIRFGILIVSRKWDIIIIWIG